MERRSRARAARALISAVVALAAWEAAATFGLVSPTYLPPPSAILPRLAMGLWTGSIVHAAGETLRHLSLGYLAAALIGNPIGMAMGRYDVVRAALRPTINFLRPLPSIAIMPVFILIFGMGPPTIAATVAFAAGWVMLLNSVDAVARVHPVTVGTARVFGTRGARFVFRVLLPAALPQMLVGMRIAIGIALVVAVVAEILVGSAGLGAYIVTSQGALRTADAFAGILTVGLIGHLLLWAWEMAQSRLVPWLGRMA